MPHTRRFLTALPALALAVLALAPAATASTGQVAIFQDDGGVLSNPNATLQTIRSLGATEVRVFVPWGNIAPAKKPSKGFDATNPADYAPEAWGPYDALVTIAKQDGINVMFDVVNPAPTWAQASGAPSNPQFRGGWKPDAAAFGQFIRALGKRYSGSYKPAGQTKPLPRVTVWSIWNEPNYGPSLSPQSNGPAIQLAAASYRGLLNAGDSGLKATGHGHDTILFGETAPHGYSNGGNFSGIAPLEFLRGLYCVNSRFQELRGTLAAQNSCPTTAAASRRFRSQNPLLFSASGFAAHPYAQGTPPNKSLVVSGQDDADFADLADIGKLESTLDSANLVYGSHTKFPIWSTEYGFQTTPPEHAAPSQHIYPLAPDTAAAYMNWAEYISYKSRRIMSYDQYLLTDPPGPDGANFASGLEFANGKAKPGLAAYRVPVYLPVTSVAKASSLEVWGAARPAHFAMLSLGSRQTVQIQFQTGSTGAFQTIATVPVSADGGYFDVREPFAHSGTLRLAWADQDGQTEYSRSVAVTVR
jgi:hypothetical protein